MAKPQCCIIYPKFKYVKAFEMDDIEQNLIITKAELDVCGCVSNACVSDEFTLPNTYLDLHVQVWNYHQFGTYAGKWVLLDSITGLGMVISIDPTNGDINIYTGGTQGFYRVVVLA